MNDAAARIFGNPDDEPNAADHVNNASEDDVDGGPDHELDDLLAAANGGQDDANQNAGSFANEPYELLDDLPPHPSLFENESEKSDSSDEEPEVIHNENERPRRGTGW